MTDSKNENTRRDFIGTTGAAAGLAALAAAFSGATVEGVEGGIQISVLPTEEQSAALMALPEKPVIMVNLLKIKNPVEYQKYGVAAQKILQSIGAEMFLSGQSPFTLIGSGKWDAVALVRYPSPQSFAKMFNSPEYQAIHHHRDAGLEGQLLIPIFEISASSDDVTADQIMSNLDSNGDGKIDLEEAPEDMKGAFGMLDANGDGSIDLNEAQTIADFMNGR